LLSRDADHVKEALEAAVRAANIVNNSYPDMSDLPLGDEPSPAKDREKTGDDFVEPIALTNYLLAHIAHAAGDLPTAQPAIQKAVKYWPDEPRWRLKAAEIFADCGEILSAIPHLEEATRLEADYSPHYLELGQAYLEISKGDMEKIELAIHALEKACDLSANNPQNWLSLARAYYEANKLEEAGASADRAINLAPDQVQPLIIRAETALKAGDPYDAHEHLLAALHLQEVGQGPAVQRPADDPKLILLLARSLDALDRHDEALSVLDMALPKAHNPLPLLIERILLLQRSQGLEAAMFALQEIANEYPDEPTVLALYAKYLAESGKVEAAIRTAQRALQVSTPSDEDQVSPPAMSENERAQVHLMLGRLLRNSGQLDQAVHHLNEAIQRSPSTLEAYLELGYTYENRREHDMALQVYNQAMKVAPKDPRPYYQAGLALKENKDYHTAETMLRRAAALAPNDLGIHRQLGAVVALNLVHSHRKATVEA
jgi:tetratricopeptide (TPR) repeat protein